jgi:hypothetical protein
MTQEEYTHPVLPSAQQLSEWETEFLDEVENLDVLLIRAFQAGADQELEACCSLLELSDSNSREFLQSARR